MHMNEAYQTIWKDVRAGRVLVGSDRVALLGLISHPFGRAKKLNPDRTECETGRIYHDAREMNEWTPSSLHPQCTTPTIQAAVLRVLILHVLWPLVKILLSKRDIDAAFKRMLLSLLDIDLFASDVPAKELLEEAWREATQADLQRIIDIIAEVFPDVLLMPLDEAWAELFRILVVIYLALTFGWAGSPGHFSVFALAAEILLQSFGPEETRLNGHEAFGVKTHVDDGCLSDAKIGYRPFLATRTYEQCVRLFFGKTAINPRKKREEGEPTQVGTWWGYVLNTLALKLGLPLAKIEKMLFVVFMNIWDWGSRRIPRRECAVMSGNCAFWEHQLT